MSYPLLDDTHQLRWWTEDELRFRDVVVAQMSRTIQRVLLDVNKAWVFHRTEGPTLVPRHMVAPGYTSEDLWMIDSALAGGSAAMRPETTSSSYMAASHIIGSGSEKDRQRKLPLCVWQVGKSYRRESSDGANAAKLRFFEFTQAEWQCIYGLNTMADYRSVILPALLDKAAWLTDKPTRIVPSDRLPGYSTQTDDIEVLYNDRWTEIASISSRTDFESAKVLEIAVGIDRVVDIAGNRPL